MGTRIKLEAVFVVSDKEVVLNADRLMQLIGTFVPSNIGANHRDGVHYETAVVSVEEKTWRKVVA